MAEAEGCVVGGRGSVAWEEGGVVRRVLVVPGRTPDSHCYDVFVSGQVFDAKVLARKFLARRATRRAAFGGMTPPAPFAPLAISLGHSMVALSPTDI